MSPKDIRTRSRRSRAWVAVQAGVSEPTAKLYEVAGPDAVKDLAKRAALGEVYGSLASVARDDRSSDHAPESTTP